MGTHIVFFCPSIQPGEKSMSHTLSITGHFPTFPLLQKRLTPSISWVPKLSLKEKSDSELVALTKSGNKKAFAELIQRWQTPIYTFCFRKLSHQEQAEELTQDIFIAAFKGMGSFRNDAKFSTWLFQIASNRCKNLHGYRERRQFKKHEPLEGTDPERKRDLPYSQLNAEEVLHKKDRAKMLHEAIQQLDDKYKEVLILFDIQNIPQAEIAKILNIQIGTIKSRIHRARMELSRILKGKLHSK